MSHLARLFSEFLGLFVDDRVFAIAILAWLAFVLLIVRASGLPAGVSAALFFTGLAANLIGSALRQARRHRDQG